MGNPLIELPQADSGLEELACIYLADGPLQVSSPRISRDIVNSPSIDDRLTAAKVASVSFAANLMESLTVLIATADEERHQPTLWNNHK